MVISRYGSNPEKFVYESDILNSLKVCLLVYLITSKIYYRATSILSQSGYLMMLALLKSGETCYSVFSVAIFCYRRSLSRGESVRYLVPDDVIDYIMKHQLYQNNHENK